MSRRPGPSPFPWRRWLLLALLGPAAFGLAWLAGFAPGFIEKYYARGLYPWIARGFALVQGWMPFSLAELLVYALPLVLLGWGALGWWKRTVGFWRLAGRGLLRLAGLMGLIGALFMGIWGFNYRRQPFHVQAGWGAGPFSSAELEALARDLRQGLITLEPRVPRQPDGTLRLDSPRQVFAAAAHGYRALPAPWPVHHSGWARPKPLIFPNLLSRTLTAGVYAPWTGEPNVNTAVPMSEWPFVAAHELAHQKGFAREDEANFLAYSVCSRHPDPAFQYSGLLAAFQEAVSQLPGAAQQPLLEGLPQGVIADWKAQRAFFQRWHTPVARASRRVYEGYLKAQGQREGLRSYGRFLDLMLAQRRVESGS